jgi:hypothetical protein
MLVHEDPPERVSWFCMSNPRARRMVRDFRYIEPEALYRIPDSRKNCRSNSKTQEFSGGGLGIMETELRLPL